MAAGLDAGRCVLAQGHAARSCVPGDGGTVWYGKLDADGKGAQHQGFANWNGLWTSITPFLQDGKGALLIYGAGGTAETRLLNDAGTGSTSMWIDGWTKNWT